MAAGSDSGSGSNSDCFRVEKIGFCDELVSGIAKCANDSDLDYFRSGFDMGTHHGFKIGDGSAYAIASIEAEKVNPKIKRIVVNCYQGVDVKGFARFICDYGRKNGFYAVEFHTTHKGLDRLINQVEKAEHVTSIYEVKL